MEGKPCDSNVVQWTIQNFSCWNEEVHKECLRSPTFLYDDYPWLELYPRNLSGIDDNVVVRLMNTSTRFFSGELSYFRSNGSLIFSQQVVVQDGDGFPRLLPGPKFEEVIAHIKENEPIHDDCLTIRLRFGIERDPKHCMCTTTLEVLKMSLEIDTKLLEASESDLPMTVSFIRYSRRSEDGLLLSVGVFSGIAKTELSLQPIGSGAGKNTISAQSCLRVLSIDDDLYKCEEKEHVFRDRNPWVFFSNPLTVRELAKKSVILLLNLKIINGDINYDEMFIYPKRVRLIPDNNTCFPMVYSYKRDSVPSPKSD